MKEQSPESPLSVHYSFRQDLQKIEEDLADLTPQIANKTFFVSGGAGFLGSWFSETAIAMGGRVICVDNLISSDEKNLVGLRTNPNFQFIQGDVSQIKVPRGVDYLVHMASIASPPLCQRYPFETLDSGIMGMRNLLAQTRKRPVERFLFTSTSEVYGNPPDQFIPTPESYYGNVCSFGPRAIYDESKRAQEAYCYAYFSEDRTPIRIARIFNTYGPRIDAKHPSQYGRALIKFVAQALKEEPITVYGDGNQTRSFCYVTDQIVGLYRLLLTEGIDGEVVNIGSQHEVPIRDLAETITIVSGSRSEVTLDSPPSYNLQDDPRRRCPDISKAKKLLNFTPKVPLEVGLARTIAWARQTLS